MAKQVLFMANPRHDMIMLFEPFGYTRLPPPVPPFLLTQNLSPKYIDRYNIMKLKFSRYIIICITGW